MRASSGSFTNWVPVGSLWFVVYNLHKADTQMESLRYSWTCVYCLERSPAPQLEYSLAKLTPCSLHDIHLWQICTHPLQRVETVNRKSPTAACWYKWAHRSLAKYPACRDLLASREKGILPSWAWMGTTSKGGNVLLPACLFHVRTYPVTPLGALFVKKLSNPFTAVRLAGKRVAATTHFPWVRWYVWSRTLRRRSAVPLRP